MDVNERIILIIKEKGPVIPVQVSKEVKDSILMASARLSELLDSKKIKISTIKVGGSPLYYLPGQENLLQNFSSNLGNVERKAYDLINSNKLLRDSAMEPAIRVALRQIKDFAIPLNVSYNNAQEIFWKWYLIDNAQAELLIKEIFSKAGSAPVKKDDIISKAQNNTGRPLVLAAKENSPRKNEAKQVAADAQEQLLTGEDQKKPKKTDDGYGRQILNFFSGNKMRVIESIETKRSLELEFIVELYTSIGGIRYFCKYKTKKKVSDADLSSALIQAQSRNLPLLFLSNGILSKKAQEMLNKEFKGIIFKKI